MQGLRAMDTELANFTFVGLEPTYIVLYSRFKIMFTTPV